MNARARGKSGWRIGLWAALLAIAPAAPAQTPDEALLEAAIAGDLAGMQAAAANGASLSAAGPTGTAMSYAVFHKDRAMISWLAANGADANQKAGVMSALESVIVEEDVALLELILSESTRLDLRRSDPTFGTPLHRVLASKNEAMIRVFFAHARGYDVDAPLQVWGSALGQAVVAKDYGLVELLLGKGADPNVETTTGSLLSRAILGQDARLLRLLVGAPTRLDPNVSGALGHPLHQLLVLDDPALIDAYLQAEGIDPNPTNMMGETPLHVAARRGNTALVKRLLALPGVDASRTDKFGKRPVDEAANPEIVRLLTRAGS